MKRLTLIIVLASFMTGGFSGCKKKVGCTDSFADNYDDDANEDDGDCSYLSRFVGSYSTVIVWNDGGSESYSSVISLSSNNTLNGLYIFGCFSPGTPPSSNYVLAVANGKNLDIPDQTVVIASTGIGQVTAEVEGNGVLNGNTLTLFLTTPNSGATLTLTKQ